jgi:enamine deaminase RidA (YjgF/YER057c/UK114 family)
MTKQDNISFFRVAAGVSECHAVFCAPHADRPFTEQLRDLQDALRQLLDQHSDLRPVFMRYFLSDIATQLASVHECSGGFACAVSAVQQPPLDGSKVALWVYLKSGATLSRSGDVFVESHGAYRHLWVARRHLPHDSVYTQTDTLLRDYDAALHSVGCSVANDCVRTWLFVDNIYDNYNAVVQARKAFFADVGLTEKTHYIASSGVEGRYAAPDVSVLFDAYAVQGLQPAQQRYLYAPTHLNATHEYGVTFERGVCVDYGDRAHVFISGTASIDNRGDIAHPDDITAQTDRMLCNIGALLAEAGAGFADVMQMIVYLRDAADYATVRAIFEKRFADIPKVVVSAKICRRGWLIETECMAVRGAGNEKYAAL